MVPFKILLMGPQGAGKGSVAHLLKKRLEIPHISMGDLLRETVQSASVIGNEINGIMKKGDLVPLNIIGKMLEDRLAKPDCLSGFILDGFPRDEEQAVLLDSIIQINFVILLQVSRDVSIKRVASRIQCSECGSIFNTETKPPKQENICDNCQATLYRREDDTEETVTKRLDIYEKETKPLVDRYIEKVIPINATHVTPEETVDVIMANFYALKDLS